MIPRIGFTKLCSGIVNIEISLFNDVDLRSLMMGYESFMVKVGLYGNTMDHNYKLYSILATNGTWYKNVWELVCFFKIRLAFQSKYRLGPV